MLKYDEIRMSYSTCPHGGIHATTPLGLTLIGIPAYALYPFKTLNGMRFQEYRDLIAFIGFYGSGLGEAISLRPRFFVQVHVVVARQAP